MIRILVKESHNSSRDPELPGSNEAHQQFFLSHGHGSFLIFFAKAVSPQSHDQARQIGNESLKSILQISLVDHLESLENHLHDAIIEPLN